MFRGAMCCQVRTPQTEQQQNEAKSLQPRGAHGNNRGWQEAVKFPSDADMMRGKRALNRSPNAGRRKVANRSSKHVTCNVGCVVSVLKKLRMRRFAELEVPRLTRREILLDVITSVKETPPNQHVGTVLALCVSRVWLRRELLQFGPKVATTSTRLTL